MKTSHRPEADRVSCALILFCGVLAAPGAFAQAAVSVAGRLNLSVEHLFSRPGDSTQMVSNASSLSIRANEVLEGAMKAGIVLTHGFDASNGAQQQMFWSKRAEFFLENGGYRLRVGKFLSESYFATADYVSLHNHDAGTSADALYAYIGSSSRKIALRYSVSPTTTMELGAGLGATSSDPATWEIALNANVKLGHIGFGFEQQGDMRQAALSGLAAVGDFRVGGYFQLDENYFARGFRNTIRVTLAYIEGRNEWHFSRGDASRYSRSPQGQASQWTVAYNRNLTNTTKLYLFYSVLSVRTSAVYGAQGKRLSVGLRKFF